MIPLDDETRRPQRFPIITVLIIAANAIVFFFELSGGDAFVTRWSMVPREIAAGQHLETILTSMFMHASWSHIIGNMIFFWAFAPQIEDAINPRRFLVFYLLGGTAAMLAQFAADPASTIPNLGASGAIAAVMGAFLVTYPRDRIPHAPVPGLFRPRYVHSGRAADRAVVSDSAVRFRRHHADVHSGGVAYLAHIGDSFGAVTALLFEDRRQLAT